MRTADAERDGSLSPEIAPLPLNHDPSGIRSVGEFGSSLRAEKYQNLAAMGIASKDLAPEWAISLEAWPVALITDSSLQFAFAISRLLLRQSYI
jgi:hypothetical protein